MGRGNKCTWAAEIVYFPRWWTALASLPLLGAEEIVKSRGDALCTYSVCKQQKGDNPVFQLTFNMYLPLYLLLSPVDVRAVWNCCL